MRKWKNKGFIDDYKIKTRRIGKFYYEINVHLVLMPQRTRKLLQDLVTKALKEIEDSFFEGAQGRDQNQSG